LKTLRLSFGGIVPARWFSFSGLISPLELSDDVKAFKNPIGMRRIAQLFGKVLAGPMFVMVTVSPEP
jgi:hypothetical protein